MEPLEILQTVPQTDLQDILVIVQALTVGFCKGLGDGSKWKYFGGPRDVVIYDICRGVIEGLHTGLRSRDCIRTFFYKLPYVPLI